MERISGLRNGNLGPATCRKKERQTMTVIIYFVGLIAHLTYSAGSQGLQLQVAALVYENNHTPELIVDSGDVLPSRNPYSPVMDASGRNHYSLLTAGVVHILGVASGPMIVAPTVSMPTVKSLPAVTGAQYLRATVKDEKTNAYAFVELEGGRLELHDYFKYMSKYNSGTPECVPSRIAFTTQASGTAVTFIFADGHDLVVKASARVTIANLPPLNMTGHFKVYADLMDGGDQAAVGKWTDTMQLCALPNIFQPSSLGKGDGADCTNTRFP